jgi:MFS transporter, DHA2 family, lincomycin resistance protein
MQLSQTKEMPQARVHVAHPAMAMIGLMIGAFVGMFSETSLNIALPSLMTALNVSQGTIQWLVTGYMLVIGICMPLSSLLSKWF